MGVAWNDRFKLGNEQVDGQHKRMFEMLNDLACLCADGSDVKHLQKTLDFLVNYTVQHFHDEEVLQLQFHYPEYERHKQLHENFKATVNDLVQESVQNALSTELSDNVNRIVVKWLVDHIMGEDKKIGEYIRSIEYPSL
jgi:hemerythrin